MPGRFSELNQLLVQIELPPQKANGVSEHNNENLSPESVTPECFNRGPVPVSPGFPTVLTVLREVEG